MQLPEFSYAEVYESLFGHELFLADGRIVFCDENQGVCVWGVEGCASFSAATR